jgi:TolB-like protein/class 3 adenylate cyclase/Tfp pilus assembly protein PilF
MPTERRLAAIMFTDIVGYTALMAESEEKGRRVRGRHRSLLGPLAEQHHGQVVDENGDELVLCFPSALDAVSCALAAQTELRDDPDLRLRIGIHLGDVVFEDGRVYGDGVNVASRIRPLSEPGGICASDEVQHSIQNQENIESRSLGRHELKNVPRPVEVFAVGRPGSVRVARRGRGRTRFWSRGRSALAVVALVVVTVIAWRIWDHSGGAAAGPIRSIAVLPLENISGDPEQEYFADGMTEAVISQFARIGSLRVISRTSVMQYKKTRKALPEIARELNVQGVLEGSVLRAGDRVRITLQLIDARNDHHLWAQSYEREVRDVLALQGEIAHTVAREVEAELTPEEDARLLAARPVDPVAHDAYLRGTLHLAKQSLPDVYRAVEYFKRAIDLDPDYARAYTALATAYLNLGWALAHLPAQEAMPKVRAAARSSLQLDDSIGSAHALLGLVLALYEFKWDEGEKEMRRAVELSPNDSFSVRWYGVYLTIVGRHPEALALLERSVTLDPLDLRTRSDHALGLLASRQYRASIDECLAVLSINPEFGWCATLGEAYLLLGEEEASYRSWLLLHRMWGRSDEFLRGFERGYQESGLQGALRHWLNTDIERSKTEYVSPGIMAFVAAMLADVESSFELLEHAYDVRDLFLPTFVKRPVLDPLRSDPRFNDLLHRMDFPES